MSDSKTFKIRVPGEPELRLSEGQAAVDVFWRNDSFMAVAGRLQDDGATNSLGLRVAYYEPNTDLVFGFAADSDMFTPFPAPGKKTTLGKHNPRFDTATASLSVGLTKPVGPASVSMQGYAGFAKSCGKTARNVQSGFHATIGLNKQENLPADCGPLRVSPLVGLDVSSDYPVGEHAALIGDAGFRASLPLSYAHLRAGVEVHEHPDRGAYLNAMVGWRASSYHGKPFDGAPGSGETFDVAAGYRSGDVDFELSLGLNQDGVGGVGGAGNPAAANLGFGIRIKF